MEIIHEFEVKKIEYSIISTYDGTYPSFNIIYGGSKNYDTTIDYLGKLNDRINRYLGFKRGKDYWLSITFE